jgi:hypothetical protein
MAGSRDREFAARLRGLPALCVEHRLREAGMQRLGLAHERAQLGERRRLGIRETGTT